MLTSGGWSTESVQVREGTIVGLEDAGAGDTQGMEGRIDCDGLHVVPGLVETQVNGGWGIDLQVEPSRLWELGGHLASIGVTAFLPTLTTNGSENLTLALDTWADGPPPGRWQGAEPIGWHLEGPWLTVAGAHDASLLRPPPSLLAEELRPDRGVRLVTLAPDISGAEPTIRELVSRGVVVSLGHTATDVADAQSAFAAGATMGTHLFNVMGGLPHRDPGLAASLLLGDAWVGLIADGHHVAPEMIDLAWRLASDRIVLVSDAVASMQPSEATAQSVARLADGTLAGSLVGLDQCVRNVMRFAGADLAAAVAAASTNPAQCLGLGDRGRIEPGARADLVGLDRDHVVRFTMIDGQLVYDAR